VRVDAGAHLDFLDLDGLLLLARLGRLLLRLELVLAVIEDLDDGRTRVWGDLYKIEPGVLCQLPRFLDLDDPAVLAVMVDQLNLGDSDLVVDPGPFLDGRGSTKRSANGQFSLRCCYVKSCGRPLFRRQERIR
jgi:hypothetical protein